MSQTRAAPANTASSGDEATLRLNPHLTFNGQCEAAFRSYETSLGGRILTMLAYRDSPLASQTPRAWGKKILHATLALGEGRLTGGDAAPGQYQKPQGFSLLLAVSAAHDADRIFQALAEAGETQLPIQETFWALRFGMLVDRFGTPWAVQCEKPA